MPAPAPAYTARPEAGPPEVVLPKPGEPDGEGVAADADAAGAAPTGCEEQGPTSAAPSTAPATARLRHVSRRAARRRDMVNRSLGRRAARTRSRGRAPGRAGGTGPREGRRRVRGGRGAG